MPPLRPCSPRTARSTLAVVYLNKEVESAVEDSARLADAVDAPAGVEVQVTGIPQLYHEFNQKIEQDLVMAETISLPIALLILLAVFGTLVAAGLPLLIAALAMPTVFAVIGLLASVMEMSIFVNNLATMIGLALAIDYSLFMVSRFREELRHHSVEIAIERMMGSVGKAVAVSGVAVAVGLSSLAVFDAAALRSMGIAGVITVASTLLYGLTVLPALLAILGPRVNRLRVPLPSFLRLHEDDVAAADRRQGHGVWAWIAARVMRHPLPHRRPGAGAAADRRASPSSRSSCRPARTSRTCRRPRRASGSRRCSTTSPAATTTRSPRSLTWDGTNLEDGISPERQDALAAYVDEVGALRRRDRCRERPGPAARHVGDRLPRAARHPAGPAAGAGPRRAGHLHRPTGSRRTPPRCASSPPSCPTRTRAAPWSARSGPCRRPTARRC